MSRIESGRQVLRDAEQALQSLLADAATDGDYSAVPLLMDWASHLSELASESAARGQAKAPKRETAGSVAKRKGKKSQQRKTKKREGYPRFIRDENCLVKIGWSKSGREEYEHRADKDSVDSIVSSLARAGRRGKRFSMESLLPCKKSDGTVIPDYQSYLTLAWLREAELVSQHGRLGYTVPDGDSLQSAVEDCWLRLAERTYEGQN
ncbi:hypothetical protein [Thalassoglobus sp.]|uniref:hypothetical protein n=1 Tax=Thalassoglobus sp. TaxID=2795869 RepID=UPI003AA9D8DB